MSYFIFSVPSASVATAFTVVLISRWRSNSLPYPPGPRPDPFVCNARQLMADNLEQEFENWGKRYGDVNYAKIFSQPLLILNSYKAAKDLLEKRGAIYSGRPRMVLVAELGASMGWGDILVHQNTGSQFRKHRRLVQEHFSARSLIKFASLQRKEVYTTFSHLGSTPEYFLKHLNRFSAGVVLGITYGYTVHSHDDKFVVIAGEAAAETVSVPPASMLVDFLPILKYVPTWMPFAGFKRHALHTRALVRQLMNIPYDHIKAQIASGTASPCIAADLLETLNAQVGSELPSEVPDDVDIRDVTAMVFVAASETTEAVISSFLFLLVLHEDVYKKLQAEIDENIGNDRLVDFDDKDMLPYFACVLREVLRWSCPVPLGIPHSSVESDQYRNQFIPNTTVIANAWAMMRNEEMYPEPHKFMPERFVGRMNEEAAMQVDAVFGFGRRLCPGKGFAEANIWLLMSNIIAIFSVGKVLDDAGRPITPPIDYTGGLVRHPKAFPCKIKCRSERAKELVSQANLLHN